MVVSGVGNVLPNGKDLPPPASPEILNSEVLYKQIEGDTDVSGLLQESLINRPTIILALPIRACYGARTT